MCMTSSSFLLIFNYVWKLSKNHQEASLASSWLTVKKAVTTLRNSTQLSPTLDTSPLAPPFPSSSGERRKGRGGRGTVVSLFSLPSLPFALSPSGQRDRGSSSFRPDPSRFRPSLLRLRGEKDTALLYLWALECPIISAIFLGLAALIISDLQWLLVLRLMKIDIHISIRLIMKRF